MKTVSKTLGTGNFAAKLDQDHFCLFFPAWTKVTRKIGFLRRVKKIRGVALRDKVRSCEIRETLNV